MKYCKLNAMILCFNLEGRFMFLKPRNLNYQANTAYTLWVAKATKLISVFLLQR